MTWRLARSLDDLRDEVNARWPRRSKASDGTVGDTSHQARPSDHNPDAAGVVRAMDVTEWDPGTPGDPTDDVAEVIAETIRHRRDPRVKYVIWSGRMFSSYESRGIPAWQWRTYTGPNGHFKHVHVSVLAGADGDEPGPWGIWPVNTTTEPSEEDDMPLSDADLAKIDALILKRLQPLNDRVTDLHAEVVEPRDGDGKSRMDRIAELVTTLRKKP